MRPISNRQSWLVLIGLALASFLGCIDFTIVNTALPAIQANLQTGVSMLQWIINSFMLVLSACMVISGRLADLYGRRKVFYVGLGLFALASVWAGISPNMGSLIAARVLQGVGVAILYTVPIAMLPSIFSSEKVGKATGILIAVNGFGLAVGPVVGGFLVELFNWRAIFFVNIPLILLSVVFLIRRLPESCANEAHKKVDWLGFLLLIIGLPAIIYATIAGQTAGWSSPLVLSLYVLALVCFVAFYFVESKVQAPIIDFKLFANRLFVTGLLANFSLAFFYTVAFFLMPIYLQSVQHESAAGIGLTLLPATAMLVLLSPLIGSLVDKHGPKLVLVTGFVLFVLSALLQVNFNLATELWYVILAYVLFGMGWACILSPSIVAAVSSVPARASGVAMGAIGTLHNFGGAVGLALGTVVYEHFSKHAGKIGLLAGYSAAMWLLAAISLFALLAVVFSLRSRQA